MKPRWLILLAVGVMALAVIGLKLTSPPNSAGCAIYDNEPDACVAHAGCVWNDTEQMCDPVTGAPGDVETPVDDSTKSTPKFSEPPFGLGEVTVRITGSTYDAVSQKPEGWFVNGQSADLMLSGFGFDNAGGPLMFNHQGGIASDGQHFILADRNNNRVLVWNQLPTSNEEPSLVLGQPNFISNSPGAGLGNLNWPVAVATDGTHLLVADTYNYRVLIWNSFPTQNGQPADLSLAGPTDRFEDGVVGWPWAVWTDGEKVVVTSTAASQVLIWNSFPTQNNQEPDVVISLDDFGTPRTIGSDGSNLVIGDHNAFGNRPGNFFWKTFPTQNNQPYDFFMGNAPGGDIRRGEIMWGPTFTPTGEFLVVSDKLYIWETFPQNSEEVPSLSLGVTGTSGGYDFGGSQSGDGSSMVYANDNLYVSLCNGNKVVGFYGLPTRADQMPDFVIGAPDLNTNTLETEFIMSNPVPATNGESLFVSSDFDRKLYVWSSLPDESGAHPDYVYDLPEAPWDNALHEDTLVLAGKQTVFIWDGLPLDGSLPDQIIRSSMGSVNFGELLGVALDDRYFYLSDKINNQIYVWEGIPGESSEPAFTLNLEGPGRLSSDGTYLAVAATERGPGGSVVIYRIDDLITGNPAVILNGDFNLPQGVNVWNGHLFVGDTGHNVVQIWTAIEDAIGGKPADLIFGTQSNVPLIGSRTLFWPAVPVFDGSYLWVGEFKFSERLLRFRVQ